MIPFENSICQTNLKPSEKEAKNNYSKSTAQNYLNILRSLFNLSKAEILSIVFWTIFRGFISKGFFGLLWGFSGAEGTFLSKPLLS